MYWAVDRLELELLISPIRLSGHIGLYLFYGKATTMTRRKRGENEKKKRKTLALYPNKRHTGDLVLSGWVSGDFFLSAAFLSIASLFALVPVLFIFGGSGPCSGDDARAGDSSHFLALFFSRWLLLLMIKRLPGLGGCTCWARFV